MTLDAQDTLFKMKTYITQIDKEILGEWVGTNLVKKNTTSWNKEIKLGYQEKEKNAILY